MVITIEKENKNILPFEENVLIKTYNYISFYLGILNSNNKNIDTLLLNEFLHIFFFRNRVDFVSSGHYHNKRFHYKNIKKKISKSINEIKKELDKNHYVIIILNEHYISNEEIHTNSNYYHDWLIYGYDDKNSVFYCSGYIGENLLCRRYGTIKISYSDISNSIKHIQYNYFSGTKKDTHSSWVNTDYSEKILTPDEIVNELNRYINPPILSIYYTPVINIDINAIKKQYLLVNKLYRKKEPFLLYVQSYRVIYEHTKVLKIAIKYILDDKNVLKECDALIQKAYLTLLKAAKFNVSVKKNRNILLSIAELLSQIETEEKRIINYAINNYKKINGD